MVTSVLDAEITTKIVRLGTRSSDERVAEFALDKMERLATAPTLDRSMRRQYARMKELEEKMTETMTSIRLPLLSWDKIQQYLDIYYPVHAENIREPPFWIADLYRLKMQDEQAEGAFTKVESKGAKKKNTVDDTVSSTIYGMWRNAADIEFLQQPPKMSKKGKERAEKAPEQPSFPPDRTEFFHALGYGGQSPPVPNQRRKLDDLLLIDAVWSMSATERLQLAAYWENCIRKNAYSTKRDTYNRLKDEYKKECQQYDEMRDEVRSQPLWSTRHGIDVVLRFAAASSARRT